MEPCAIVQQDSPGMELYVLEHNCANRVLVVPTPVLVPWCVAVLKDVSVHQARFRSEIGATGQTLGTGATLLLTLAKTKTPCAMEQSVIVHQDFIGMVHYALAPEWVNHVTKVRIPALLTIYSAMTSPIDAHVHPGLFQWDIYVDLRSVSRARAILVVTTRMHYA